MPQALLPLIPEGASPLGEWMSVVRGRDVWTYFVGVAPVFSHAETDQASFRMITAQLVCQGTCRQVDITRTFGVSENSVKRHVKKYQAGGPAAFYQSRKVRGAPVMTDEVVSQVQALLGQGHSRAAVAQQLGLKPDTLRKAIEQGRVRKPAATAASVPLPAATDKSARSVADVSAEMGVACTRPDERVLAALGVLQGASTQFEACRDVSFGGVLCALPALTQTGLFQHLPTAFPALSGYYTTTQILTLLAYMALSRIQTVEQLQYQPPGELGKLLGLDRVPEVRCLRKKLSQLSQGQAAETWAGLLSQQWLQADPELAGKLYVDGHVRLYHGELTKLPRRYVSRDKLCLRGTTDYWVNDALGKPFFVVERPIDQGMLEALRSNIVPRLLRDVPSQPSAEELDRDPHRCRFTLIFDREGYNPKFFQQMWQTHRIACITYHKYPGDDWRAGEFSETQLRLPNGELITLQLAERGSRIGNKNDGWIWVREIRKLAADGHQVSLLSTAYGHLAHEDAAALFSRWSQENFFRYMMEHYALDLLSEYGTEPIPGTNQPVINPAWRVSDNLCRSLRGRLQTQRAAFTAHTLGVDGERAELAPWKQRKAELLEEIQQLEQQLTETKAQRKQQKKRIPWDQLPAEHQCQRLLPNRKRLLDTVHLIAYRAETVMTQIVRECLSRSDDAHAVIRDLMRSAADILPDLTAQTLTVKVHAFANLRTNQAVDHLLTCLNDAEFNYPGTNLKLVYNLIRPPNAETQAK